VRGRGQRAAAVRGVLPSGRRDPAQRQFNGPVARRASGQFPVGRRRQSTETHRPVGSVPGAPDRGNGFRLQEDGGLRTRHV